MKSESNKLIPLSLNIQEYLFSFERYVCLKDKIYAVSYDGKTLFSISIDGKECKAFDIDCMREDYGNYAGVFARGSVICIVPKYNNKIIIFDTNKEVVMEHKSEFDGVRSYAYLFEDEVIIFFKSSDTIERFKLTDYFFSYEKTGHFFENVSGSVFSVDTFFVLENDGNVYSANKNFSRIDLLSKKSLCDNGFAIIADAKDSLVIFPTKGEDIIFIDKITGERKILNEYPDEFFYYEMPEWSKYFGFCEDEDRYYVAARLSDYLIIIEKKTGNFEWKYLGNEIVNEFEEITKFLEKTSNEYWKGALIKEENYSLESFIKAI